MADRGMALNRRLRLRPFGYVRGLLLVAACSAGRVPPPGQDALPTVEWDRGSIRLVRKDGCYGRVRRLEDRKWIAVYEIAGEVRVSFSEDDGRTWSNERQAARIPYGNAANPELLVLSRQHILLFVNERPNDGVHPFAISMTRSRDGGITWSPLQKLYEAGTRFEDGCWEPAALQMPDGEIRLVFANEGPYRASNEQEISLMVSKDEGATWGPAETISFRPGHRDGMPVPILSEDGSGMLMAIEDSGLQGAMKPVIVDVQPGRVARPDTPHRWPALAEPLAADVSAAAPYLVRLPSGHTLLSVQSTEGGKAERMVVYVGTKDARGFRHQTEPFALPADVKALWNSLAVRDRDAVFAVSTTTINGTYGVWIVDGSIRNPQTR